MFGVKFLNTINQSKTHNCKCNLSPTSGGSRGGAQAPWPPPLLWVKKEEITEERKAGRASKTTPPPLGQGLDLPLPIILKGNQMM